MKSVASPWETTVSECNEPDSYSSRWDDMINVDIFDSEEIDRNDSVEAEAIDLSSKKATSPIILADIHASTTALPDNIQETAAVDENPITPFDYSVMALNSARYEESHNIRFDERKFMVMRFSDLGYLCNKQEFIRYLAHNLRELYDDHGTELLFEEIFVTTAERIADKLWSGSAELLNAGRDEMYKLKCRGAISIWILFQ